MEHASSDPSSTGRGGAGAVDTPLPPAAGGTVGSQGGTVNIAPPFLLCDAGAGGAAAGTLTAKSGDVQAAAGAAGAPQRDDACAPPKSVCADDSTLVYYANGTCVNGHCAWIQLQTICNTGCQYGGCIVNVTF